MLDEPEATTEFVTQENDASAAAIAQIPLHVVIEARPGLAKWRR
jgi:hypothetical protein